MPDRRLTPVFDRGVLADHGYAESVCAVRGLLVGLVLAIPFWTVIAAMLALSP